MLPPLSLSGVVLAGGESRRMGQDKATLVVNGQPLWRRQADVLLAAGAHPVAINRRIEQAPLRLPPELPLWRDQVSGIGPLAGLHAALSACPTPWLAVVAIDLPRIESGWYLWLATHCAEGVGAIPRHPAGHYEPLAAIYPASGRDEVQRRVHGRDHSLQSLADYLIRHRLAVSVSVPRDRLEQLANWNARDQLTGASASAE